MKIGSPLVHTALGATGITLLAGVAAADPNVTSKAAGGDAEWTLIQTAGEATFDGQRLTLSGVSPQSLMFTDRPQRLAEAIPTPIVVRLWEGNNTFAKDPPNAGVTGLADG